MACATSKALGDLAYDAGMGRDSGRRGWRSRSDAFGRHAPQHLGSGVIHVEPPGRGDMLRQHRYKWLDPNGGF